MSNQHGLEYVIVQFSFGDIQIRFDTDKIQYQGKEYRLYRSDTRHGSEYWTKEPQCYKIASTVNGNVVVWSTSVVDFMRSVNAEKGK